MNKERFVHVLYCDDIRQEIGNKLSYMGTYEGIMLVPAFPVTIPKLAIAIRVSTACDRPFKSLTVRVLREDAVLAEVSVPEERLSVRPIPNSALGPEDEISLEFLAIVNIAPLTLDAASKLRVRAQTEDEELKGAALIIMDKESG